ncbi:MAG: hypothetical protein KIS83_05475 [Rubrivivax sp.]|nr:hypothetical protein [Rubrivivax sp.]
MSAPFSSRPRARVGRAGRVLLAALATTLLLAGCGGGGGPAPAAPAAPTPTPPPPSPPAVQVDESRAASATATAAAGGTVQATGADGTVYTLTVPPGALGRDTTITIAPLLSADGVAIDRLVAGVRAEPSGLRFATPATLALQLPAGRPTPPYGLRGFLAANDSSALEFVPQRTEGGALTVAVTHFSVVGVAQFDDWLWACRPERIHNVAHQNACARLRPLFDVERARVAAEGGDLDVVFILDVMGELQTWAQNGLAQRMADARQQPLSEAFEHAANEWASWLHLWDVAGEQLTDRMNEFEGRLLGALIDQIQEQYRLLLVARMEALNAECLRDRGRVGHYVDQVWLLEPFWTVYQDLRGPLPWELDFCVDIHIDAFVPPVLTPGQDANVPIDIRVRFSDGVELPNQRLSVVVTATDASVTPAGGILTAPIAQNVTLRSTVSTSTLTITAEFANPRSVVPVANGFEVTSVDTNRPRTRTFTAGAPPVVYPTGTWTGWLRTSYSRVVVYSDGTRDERQMTGQYQLEITLQPPGPFGPPAPTMRVPQRGGDGRSVRTFSTPSGIRTEYGYGCVAPRLNFSLSGDGLSGLRLAFSEAVEGYTTTSSEERCDLFLAGLPGIPNRRPDQNVVVNNENSASGIFMRLDVDGVFRGGRSPVRIDRSGSSSSIVSDITEHSVTWDLLPGQGD